MERLSRQKINMETSALNHTLNKMDLMHTYWTFHPKAAEYTFFSSGHVTSSKIDHTLGYKSSLNKYKKIKIMSSIFSDHNGMKLEIIYKKKTGKTQIRGDKQHTTEQPMSQRRNQRRNF